MNVVKVETVTCWGCCGSGKEEIDGRMTYCTACGGAGYLEKEQPKKIES